MTKLFESVIEKTVEKVLQKKIAYNPNEFITRKELAKRWNVCVETIASMHKRENYSPTITYYQFGRAKSYKWSDCMEFAAKNLRIQD